MIKETIKIILVDDQSLFRDGVKYILSGEEFNIIGEASEGKELLYLIEEKKLTPDIILLDIDMPQGMSGSETLKLLKEKHPHLKVIMLSMFDDANLMLDFKKKGANAYLTKKTGHKEFTDTIRRVRFWVDYTNISPRLRSIYTEREITIIPLIIAGYSNVDIGEYVGVSLKTIELDRSRIYEKTGSKNYQEFMLHSIERGLKYLGNSNERKTLDRSQRE